MICESKTKHNINRCLVKYSPRATTTNQQGIKSAKNADYRPILIILGGSKNSGTHTLENHLHTLYALFFGRAQHKMDQKRQ